MTSVKQLSLTLLIFATMTVPAFGLFSTVGAQDFCNTPEGAATVFCKNQTNKDPITGNDGIIETIIDVIILITAISSVIVVVIGGFQMVVSGGDSQRVAKSRSMIIYGVIGLVIAIFAQVIVVFVLNKAL